MLSSVLAFVDDVDAQGRKSASECVFHVERLAQTETRGHGPHDGNQRVVYGHLPHGVAAQQLVVECEPDGRDGDEQQQAYDAEHVDMRQRAAEGQSRDNEQQTAYEEAVACAYEDVHPSAQSSRHQVRTCATDGVEDNHAVAQPYKLSAVSTSQVQRHDTAEAHDAAQHFSRCQLVALETGTRQQHHEEGAQRVEDSRPRPLAV